jgi:hypothetical protein
MQEFPPAAKKQQPLSSGIPADLLKQLLVLRAHGRHGLFEESRVFPMLEQKTLGLIQQVSGHTHPHFYRHWQ